MRYNIPSIESIQGASNAASAGVQTTQQTLTSKVSDLRKEENIKSSQVNKSNQSELQDKSLSQSSALSPHEEADKLEGAVDDLNQRLESEEINVAFAVDENSGRVVVQIKDSKSGELIRQVPSEETLKFAHSVQKGVGTILDSKA